MRNGNFICRNAFSRNPYHECYDYYFTTDEDGKRKPVYSHCPKIAKCEYAVVPAVLVPDILKYEREDENDVSYNESVKKAAMDLTGDKALSGRVANKCASMGIFSLKRLRSMPMSWELFIPKVDKIGPKTVETIIGLRI